MDTHYRERLTPSPAWWIGAAVFAVAWGWIVLVATTWTPAIITTAVVFAGAAALLHVYGFAIDASTDGLRVGGTHLPAGAIGAVTALDARALRALLGADADARAWLRTRPYVETGVRVDVVDPADPTPYWLISSRHPETLAAALLPARTDS